MLRELGNNDEKLSAMWIVILFTIIYGWNLSIAVEWKYITTYFKTLNYRNIHGWNLSRACFLADEKLIDDKSLLVK